MSMALLLFLAGALFVAYANGANDNFKGVASVALHFLSSGAVSFARGLNDAPKIVGLLAVVEGFRVQWGLAAVGTVMAIGGLLNARRVAEITFGTRGRARWSRLRRRSDRVGAGEKHASLPDGLELRHRAVPQTNSRRPGRCPRRHAHDDASSPGARA